jgi:hypothetical protein
VLTAKNGISNEYRIKYGMEQRSDETNLLSVFMIRSKDHHSKSSHISTNTSQMRTMLFNYLHPVAHRENGGRKRKQKYFECHCCWVVVILRDGSFIQGSSGTNLLPIFWQISSEGEILKSIVLLHENGEDSCAVRRGESIFWRDPKMSFAEQTLSSCDGILGMIKSLSATLMHFNAWVRVSVCTRFEHENVTNGDSEHRQEQDHVDKEPA